MEDQETNKPVQQEGADQEPPREPNPEAKVYKEKDYFEIVYSSVLGFLCALLVFVAILLAIAGMVYLLDKGYDRWFSTEGLISVGENGYMYDQEHECFVKPYPNRRVLQRCEWLIYDDMDSIGIVRMNNQYRYINLNNLAFLNAQLYAKAELFHNGRALAIANDTLYHLSSDGTIVIAEPSTWVYASIEKIVYIEEKEDEDGGTYYSEISTGLFRYEDSNHNYGLMSADFTRLTEPLYSDVTAQSKEVFFCEYLNSGLGVLINKNGELIK